MFYLLESVNPVKCSAGADEQWEKGKALGQCQMRDTEPICFISSLQVYPPFLRFWLSIRQNAVVVWGQEEWLKANLTLSHLYVHLKRLIREMGLAWVCNQSNQNAAATWNSWRFLQRWAECNVLSAPSQSDTPVAGEGSLGSHLCTSWLFPLCLH